MGAGQAAPLTSSEENDKNVTHGVSFSLSCAIPAVESHNKLLPVALAGSAPVSAFLMPSCRAGDSIEPALVSTANVGSLVLPILTKIISLNFVTNNK
jgi:hypothetical protein